MAKHNRNWLNSSLYFGIAHRNSYPFFQSLGNQPFGKKVEGDEKEGEEFGIAQIGSELVVGGAKNKAQAANSYQPNHSDIGRIFGEFFYGEFDHAAADQEAVVQAVDEFGQQ